MAELPALLSESSFSGPPTEASSNVASATSTPPTTVADSDSLDSEHLKTDNTPIPMLEEAEPLASVTVAIQDVVQVRIQQSETPADPPAESLAPTPTSERRTRHPRVSSSAPVYNLAKLSGTDVHGKRRAKGDIVSDKRRRTISGDTLINDGAHGGAHNGSLDSLVKDGIEALDLDWSIKGPKSPRRAAASASSKKTKESPAKRVSTRSSSSTIEALTTTVSALGKRGRKIFQRPARMSRELMRLRDTKEFAHIDDKPVLHTVWSNGKFVDPSELETAEAQPARKRRRTGGEDEEKKEKEKAKETAQVQEEAPSTAVKQKRVKKWMDKGLYAGQDAPIDIFKGLTTAEKKKLAQLPELVPSGKVNKILPMPIFNGLRMLINGRDFKLPFDVCNPLPPGQPKPDEWRKMTRNRFVGDAATYWRKTDHFKDYQSKCVCTAEDGCAEDCQNRIMLYECDDRNCNAGEEHCTNRAFQNLQERTKKGGRYRVGVEVMKTSDRGYGVRSNRCFEPNQIIMEYTGEIITEEECERRMNEVYKDNECYYLMSFDQNMIIDATTGNIARFVNHSCSPNCRMEKWIVRGQPRMALFAGDRPITTGEELTYDYNFDPFSAKNVQKCLCGSANCRGVLGPKKRAEPDGRPKSAAAVEAAKNLKEAVKGKARAGKRKLKELLGGQEDEAEASGGRGAAKKRRVALLAPPAKPITTSSQAIKRSLSAASLKAAKSVAKGAATAVRKAASSISVASRAALAPATPARGGAVAVVRKSASAGTLRTYSKGGRKQMAVSSSRRSSETIVAHPEGDRAGSAKKGKRSSTASSLGKKSPASSMAKKSPASYTAKKSPASSARSVKSRKSVLVASPGSVKFPKRKSAAAASPGRKSVKSTTSSPRRGLELSRAHKIRRVMNE